MIRVQMKRFMTAEMTVKIVSLGKLALHPNKQLLAFVKPAYRGNLRLPRVMLNASNALLASIKNLPEKPNAIHALAVMWKALVLALQSSWGELHPSQ